MSVGTEEHCALSGVITADLQLTAGNIYQLDGEVQIGEPAAFDGTGGTQVTLTIDPGVTIYGDVGALPSLHITRGSMIDARGTREEPIVFTSAGDLGIGALVHTAFDGGALDDPNFSAGGVIIIDGAALINDGDAVGPNAEFFERDGYGGSVADDSSGTLQFVQIRYPAADILLGRADNHGLVLRGVGSGTTIEHLHIHNAAGGGLRFLGGSADLKYFVFTDGDRSSLVPIFTGEALSWRDGWAGRAQFGLVLYNSAASSTSGAVGGNFGGQILGSDLNDDPVSRPVVSNFTIIGGNLSADGNGLALTNGAQAEIYNSIVADFADVLLRIRGSGASDRDPADYYVSGDLALRSVLLDSDLDTDSDPFSEVLEYEQTFDVPGFADAREFFLQAGDGNAIEDVTVTSRAFVNGSVEAGVAPVDVTGLSDADFTFEDVDFIGAVNEATFDAGAVEFTQDWTSGWTFNCLLDCEN